MTSHDETNMATPNAATATARIDVYRTLIDQLAKRDHLDAAATADIRDMNHAIQVLQNEVRIHTEAGR